MKISFYRDLIKTLALNKSSAQFLVLTVLSFSFSIAVILGTIGLMDGFETILKKYLKKSSGDFIIRHSDGFFTYNERLKDALNVKSLKNYSLVIQTEGFLIYDDLSKGVVLKGIDPSTFNDVGQLNITPESEDIVIGEALAKELGIGVNANVTLAFGSGNQSLENRPNLEIFRVSQIIKHGIYEKDMRFVYLSRNKLQSILGSQNRYNLIVGNFKKGADIQTEVKKLNQALPAYYQCRPYWSEFSSLLDAVKVEKYSITIILQLIVIISIFNIVSFIYFLNEKRSQEIFILRALGVSGKKLFAIWMTIIFLIWAASCVTGVILTEVFNFLLQNLEILQLPGDIYVLSNLSLVLGMNDYLLVFLIALFWVLLIAGFVFFRNKNQSVISMLKKEFYT